MPPRTPRGQNRPFPIYVLENANNHGLNSHLLKNIPQNAFPADKIANYQITYAVLLHSADIFPDSANSSAEGTEASPHLLLYFLKRCNIIRFLLHLFYYSGIKCN